MRPLATLATLLLGLIATATLVVTVVSPVNAHHCAGGHANFPDCDAPPPPEPGATLGDLSCTTDQIAKYDGTNWMCAADVDTTIPDTDTLAGLGCTSDQIAKFNGANWECATHPPPPDGGIGVLLDADEVTIGKIVSIIDDNNITVDFVMDFPPDQILLNLVRGGGVHSEYEFRPRGSVYFETPDCTGIGYMREATVGESRSRFFDSALRIGFPVGQDSIDDLRLYIPSDDPPTIKQGLLSTLGAGSCSTPGGGINLPDAIPAILLESDLHTAFPKPFSVELY